jgi:hypothetical protein
MIISLYTDGKTVRDIGHHLARILGTELSHETISKITDSVLESSRGHRDPLHRRPGPSPRWPGHCRYRRRASREGTADGGIYKVSIPRGDMIRPGWTCAAGWLGVTTAVNFQPAGGGPAN